MKKIFIALLVVVMCVTLCIGCSPTKVKIKDDGGDIEVSVDGDIKDDKVDIEVKTEDGEKLNISAEQSGDWPKDDLPKGFPEFRGGSINGTMVNTSGNIKNVIIAISSIKEKEITKYAESFSDDGYTEVMKMQNDGFMWVQQKDKCTVTVAYVKASNEGTITVQVEE